MKVHILFFFFFICRLHTIILFRFYLTQNVISKISQKISNKILDNIQYKIRIENLSEKKHFVQHFF